MRQLLVWFLFPVVTTLKYRSNSCPNLPLTSSCLYASFIRFNDDGIWSDKNTVRIWENPQICWTADYPQTIPDSCICKLCYSLGLLPLLLPSLSLTAASELPNLSLETPVTIIGEVTAIRKYCFVYVVSRFGKKLTFLFVNTSNVFFDSQSNQYWYYENNAYDTHNSCLNNAPILLKLSASEVEEAKYNELFALMLTLKNRMNQKDG